MKPLIFSPTAYLLCLGMTAEILALVVGISSQAVAQTVPAEIESPLAPLVKGTTGASELKVPLPQGNLGKLPALPKTDQSNISQPETIQPETIQPETTQPETTQPEAIQPKITQPETTQPETTQPKTAPSPISDSPAALKLETPGSNALNGSLQFLSPITDQVMDVPATTVTLSYPLGAKVTLKANGVDVPDRLIGRTEQNKDTNLTTTTWYGVPLQDGVNSLTAETTIDGQPHQSAVVKITVRGAATKMTLKTQETRIPADGKSIAHLEGELQDKQGQRSNRDGIITLSTTAGEWLGEDADKDQPGFQVKATQGKFTAQLRSALVASAANIRATDQILESFTQVSFETNLRPSIATGVIDLRLGRRGTDFYRSLRDFLPLDGDYGTQLSLKGAVFTTGKIGEWLFTGAYNSDHALNLTCDGETRLFRSTQQNCDNQYPVYGDNSQSFIVAPSTDQVYLRLERTSPVAPAGTDFAMWGDYNTEEFTSKSQEFSAITRQLHGAKVNYNLGDLQLTGLFANNVQGFQRDTIAPDGTSGYYFLSRRILVQGSEDVYLELEELNRPGTVVERKKLSRGPDYEIDYDRGSLIFRTPILRTDVGKEGETLVRRIVTSYQYETKGSDSKLYGMRAKYHLSRAQNQESWLGATYLRENQGDRDFELYGVDALFPIGKTGTLIGEYAHSSNVSELLGPVSGDAYRLEAQGELAKGVRGRAFYRSAGEGFANNATVSFVPGQTRYGVQLDAKVGPQTSLRGQFDHETNKGTAVRPLTTTFDLFAPRQEALPGAPLDNSLTTISAGLQQRLGASDLTVDWLHRSRTDAISPNNDSNSDQLRSRLNIPLAKNLTFLAQNETTLSSQNDVFYPDRSLFGLNWAVVPGINVQLAQQFYTKGQYSGQSITTFNVAGDYKLGKDTTISGRYSIFHGDAQWNMSGAIGVKQALRLTPGLKADFAYEHVFGGFVGQSAAGGQFVQPFAPGQSAASLGVTGGDSYSVGLDYNEGEKLQASARYEHRSSSSGSNTTLNAGVKGKLSPALTALVHYQRAGSANQTLGGLGTTADLKVGLAYREPGDDRFNALLKYEYRKNPSITPESILFGSGNGSRDHLFSLEGIYAPNWQWEFYGKFALRNSRTYLSSDLVGTSTVSLAQLRATYHLDDRWDLTGEGRLISQPSLNYHELGWVVEAGYYLTPNLRLAAGYSFGKVSDRDFSGSRSAGGFYGGITVKVDELFNGFGLQKRSAAKPQPSPTQTKAIAPNIAN